MTLTPEERMKMFGGLVRAARLARGMTQQRVADDADVSRAQLALLEKGSNVSVLFLLRVAALLDLDLELVAGQAESNAAEILSVVDRIGSGMEELRSLALQAVLPASERRRLEDTPALKEFIARHAKDAKGLSRLAEAMTQLADESPRAPRQPKRSAVRETRPRRRSGEK